MPIIQKKIAFPLRNNFDFSLNLNCLAIAVGFPTTIKRRIGDRSMISPCMKVVAHFNEKSVYPKITISDVLNKSVPDCSGMSGGPMFVETDDQSFLVGIINQQPSMVCMEKNQAVISAESVTIERLERWIEHACEGELTIMMALTEEQARNLP